jgi:hypothetical protein
MTYPIILIRAFVALRQAAARSFAGSAFGRRSVMAAAGHSSFGNQGFGRSDFSHSDDALIGGIGTTAATALILLA